MSEEKDKATDENEYGEGYRARINKEPFDCNKSKHWQRGWYDANAWYQMID